MKKILCTVFLFIFVASSAFAKPKQVDYDTLIKNTDSLAIDKRYKKAAKILRKADTSTFNETQKENIQKKLNLYAFLSHFNKTYDAYTHSAKYFIKDAFPGQIQCAVLENGTNYTFAVVIKIRHSSSTWLFPQSITILYDGKTFSFVPPMNMGDDVKCSSGTCTYKEDRAIIFSEDDLKFIKDMSVANSVSMRIYGQYHYLDEKITDTNKNNISRMIDLYYFLKNGGQF